MEPERTLALIKPDAVKAGKAEEIKQLVEIHGFTIITQQKLQLTRARAEEFYGEHLGKPFFPKLVDFMTSGPVWAMVLSKVDAIKEWRSLMGPTNVFVARQQVPRSLRALYGTDGTQNATHGSDSPTSAAREIKFFFPNLVLEPLLDMAAAKVYITQQLQPALSAALTALAREKPSAERFEAITYLAEYLLNNNPNKPRIVMPDAWDPSNEQEDDEEEFQHAKLARIGATAAEEQAVQAQPAQVQSATETTAAVTETADTPAALGSAHASAALSRSASIRQQQLTAEQAGNASSRGMKAVESVKKVESIRRDTEVPPRGVDSIRSNSGSAVPKEQPAGVSEAAVDNLDYTPEQQAAAIRIQAAGRGMLGRKRVAVIKRTQDGPDGEQAADVEEEAQEDEQQAAADGEVTPEGSDQVAPAAADDVTPEASQDQAMAGSGTEEVTPEGSAESAGAGGSVNDDVTPEGSGEATAADGEVTPENSDQ